MSGLQRMVWLAITLGASGCLSMASFQEVETMSKHETQIGVGATVSGYQIDLGQEDPTKVMVPALNLWGRHGLTDHFELHGRVWAPLGATIGGKVQLLGTPYEQGFGLSTGLDVGYLTVSSGDSTTKVLDTYVPLYAGYRVSPGFATYLVPKYLLRDTFGSSGTELQHLVGGTLGLAAGKKAKFYLEGTGVYNLSTSNPSWTGGIGVGF
ncbi:MAG: hypothetical protein ABMB14_11945 [Myxococcota bacterium]